MGNIDIEILAPIEEVAVSRFGALSDPCGGTHLGDFTSSKQKPIRQAQHEEEIRVGLSGW